MNHLFTYKARVILFSLLACYFTSKAQAPKDTTASAKPASAIDTALGKKSAGSQLLKTDTTLVIKAGATLVHKADTTMVIDPDGSIAKKFNEMVAAKEKADQANNTGTKVDSALIKPTAAVNTATPPAVNPTVSTTQASTVIATTVPNSDASLPASQQSNAANTQQQVNNQQPAVSQPQTTQQASNQQSVATQPQTTQQQATINLPVKKDSSSTTQVVAATNQPTVKKDTAQQAVNSGNQLATQQVNNGGDQSAKKADSALVVKADTLALKKTDTIPAKKSDTTLMKKSDTTMMVQDTTPKQIKAKNAYLEVGGPGLAISVNYDTRFHDERNGWGYRIGLGFFSSGGNTVETVPFQVNYLVGEHALMLELGAGTTFLNSTGTNVGNSKWEFDKVTGFIATATIGFRYQPEHKGLNFRIGFVPILYDEGIIPAGGVSIGYTFK